MIIGWVNEYHEAIIPLQISDHPSMLEVVVDTGFQGADLLLPSALIRRLRLAPAGMMTFRMANEQDARFTYYDAQVVWHNSIKRVKVLESENSYLASADLLAGSRILIDMTPGGAVAITELASL